MLISMAPNEEVKTIHASLNDGSLRRWEFEPYTENGKIELTDQDYATIQSIKGNTVKFNQLCLLHPTDMTVNGITRKNNGDGSVTVSGTATADTRIGITSVTFGIHKLVGHKILYWGIKGGSDSTYYQTIAYIGETTKDIGNGVIWEIYDTPYSGALCVFITNGTTIDITYFPQMFDLTEIFGQGNEPSSVSDFETWLSNNIGLLPYYDYTPGTLIPFNGTGLKTENASQTENSTLDLSALNTLFPTGMKDVPDYTNGGTIYDEATEKKGNTRVGGIDLGTLNWIYESANTRFKSNALTNSKNPSGSTENPNAICSRYPVVPYSGLSEDKTLTIIFESSGNKGEVWIKDTSYSDPVAFKQAMSGVMLYYELATPIEQDISLDLTYPIWNNGTEQILPVNGSTPTTSPMVATIEYPDRTEDVNFLYKQTTFESAIPQFGLVCKNQELPMTLEDGKLICECDSSITNESGFFDAKVKMQDLDSVAYSQKIQLHVERGIND